MAVPNQAGWRIRKVCVRLTSDNYIVESPSEMIYGDFERAKRYLVYIIQGFAKRLPDDSYVVAGWLEDDVNGWTGQPFKVENTEDDEYFYLGHLRSVTVDPVTVTRNGHSWKVVAEGHPKSYIKSAGKT